MPNLSMNDTQALNPALMTPQILPGPIGPGLMYKGQTVHWPEDPLGEARQWLDEAAAQREPGPAPAMVFILGLGLGWHLKIIRDRFPGIRLVVYEPTKELVRTYIDRRVTGFEAEIVTDWPSFEAFVARELVHKPGPDPLIVTVPAYRALWPREAARFHSHLKAELSRREVIEKTKEATDSAFLNNLIENIRLCCALPDVLLLKGRLTPRPAFVVGAGPSLDQNGAQLKEAAEYGLIICASAAVKPLLNLGVSPQVIMVLESADTARYLELTPQEAQNLQPQTVLAGAAGCHPAHFKVPGYYRSLYHLNGGQAQLLSQGLFLPQGGNAGTAAFALAYVWGLNPLILVGQDQAYQGRLLHAADTADSVTEDDPGQTLTVPGVFGTTVETNTGLLASLNWYAEAAQTVKRKNSRIRLINASAAGAAIRGFEEIPLNAVLASLPRQTPLNLAAHLDRLPKPSLKEIKGDLRQMGGILGSLRQLAGRQMPKALSEMAAISRASAFMAQILTRAMKSGSRAGVLKELTKAEGLVLKMLSGL